MKKIETSRAPKAVGHYVQAIHAGNWIYCSGQLSIHPETNQLLQFDGDVHKQTVQILKNLSAVLEAAGASLNHVVKVTVYLTNINDFISMNLAFDEVFGDHYPTRSCVQVAGLPKGMPVEIDAIAYLGE